MEDFEFNNLLTQKLKKCIKELENIQSSTFTTKFTELYSILTQYTSFINTLCFESIKYKALQHTKIQFLELLCLLEPDKLLKTVDKKFLYILIEEIYTFVNSKINETKEPNNSKIMTFDENTAEENTKSVQVDFSMQADESIKNETEQRSESSAEDENNFYINFIDDEFINYIFDIFNILIESFTNTFTETLHKQGFFDLLNALVTDKSCMLLQMMYKSKVYNLESQDAKPKNAYKMPIMEVQRKYFETKVVVKEKQEMNFYILTDNFTETKVSIYKTVADEFFTKNGYYFMQEFGMEGISNLVLYYLTITERNNDDTMKLFEDDNIIGELKLLVLESEDEKFPFIYNLLQTKAVEKQVIIKYSLDSEFNNKLIKRLESKELRCRKEIINILFNIMRCIKSLNLELTEEISMRNEFYGLQNRKFIGNIFELLNYAFAERNKVLFVLSKLYAIFDKEMFYRLSYFIAIKNLERDAMNKRFIEMYLQEAVAFYTASSYNAVRMLFPPPKTNISRNETENTQIEDKNIESGVNDNALIKTEINEEKIEPNVKEENVVHNLIEEDKFAKLTQS